MKYSWGGGVPCRVSASNCLYFTAASGFLAVLCTNGMAEDIVIQFLAFPWGPSFSVSFC